MPTVDSFPIALREVLWGDRLWSRLSVSERRGVDPIYLRCRALAAQILDCAVEDWRKILGGQPAFGFTEDMSAPARDAAFVSGGNKGDQFLVTRSELLEFFNSTWFEELCDACDLDAEAALERLHIKPRIQPYWKQAENKRRVRGEIKRRKTHE